MRSHYYGIFIKHFKFGYVSTFYSSLNPMKYILLLYPFSDKEIKAKSGWPV